MGKYSIDVIKSKGEKTYWWLITWHYAAYFDSFEDCMHAAYEELNSDAGAAMAAMIPTKII